MIKARNAFLAWKKALKFIIKKGKKFEDQDGRIFYEIKNLIIKTENEGIEKPIELLKSFDKWIYPSLDEIKKIMFSKQDILGYYYVYGKRIFNFEGKNQVDNYIVPLLNKYPTTRRATIIVYDPTIDSSVERKETPGLIAIDFKIRNNKLYITGIIRSNDIFFGWPANIYQLSLLQGYVKEKLKSKVSLGPLTTISLSAHIFEDQLPYIKEIFNKR